ncbi:mannan-binding lectin serine protease 1 isoform X1 [Alosa sapidissima]|uniref:mannan-binding lectin serine protease 1 isoform X1 n=1 Tax=Alosa sapidissima TaxID=34773 RepID=UPI001C09C8C5|nr:mannan-binding lectin serine protease 1 isoform X1 [Alosa sapidissima]XP_041920124.1 mannan-binding lectin serine protease 1 isoform X1 [Alosa sapidissima]XP_041920125.1 mannan-binding lectin serine protease 1 isoform X1 [Alosa sapidissima]
MAASAQATGALLFLAMCALSRGAGVIHLTDMYGTIQTPNFPESYPKESEVQWNISVPEGFQIRLYFMHFDVEPSYLCEYDYVKLLSDQDELAVFCGKESTDTEQVPGDDVITSVGNVLSVVFRSDFSNEERYSGFEAHYSAMDVDECSDRNDEDLACDHLCHNYIGGYYCSCRYGYLLHSDNRTCKVECSDGVYTERTGVISSSDFPQPYPKSSDCLYRIQLEEGFLIALDFHDTFDIEDHPEVTCPYDYLKIQVGQRTLGPFCGDRSPGRIQTGSSSVTILFHSDNSGENLGWKLTYSAAGSECPVPMVPSFGHLEPLQPKYSFKDHVLVTCDTGYVLFKDGEVMEHHQMDCLQDGTWSSEVPPCTLIDCGPPEEIVKGEVVFDGPDNSTLFGASFQYRCLEDPQSTIPTPPDAIPTPPDAIPTPPDATPTPPNSILTPPTTPPANNSTYITRPVSNGTYVCGERGKWTNVELGTKLPSCLPACGEPSQPLPSHVRRIVGGRVASAGQFPWQARLSVEDSSRVPEGRWFGSGALLSASWVVTAAHVLRSPRRDPSVVPVSPGSVRVHLGLADLRRPPVASAGHAVQRLLLHPRFDPRNYNHDIALLRLAQPAHYTPLVRPVCLPLPWAEGQPPAPPPNTLGLVAGWGVMAANGSADSAVQGVVAGEVEGEGGVSDVLRYVKLPVVERSECEGSYASRSRSYNITSGMFCAGFYEGGRDTCQGDSGGAFVTQDPRTGRWVVQGLVSWGGPEECGSRRVYGVYTRVAKYAHWLHSHMDTDRWW